MKSQFRTKNNPGSKAKSYLSEDKKYRLTQPTPLYDSHSAQENIDRKLNKGGNPFNLTSTGFNDRLRPATSKHQFVLKDPALPSINHLIFSAKQRSKNEDSFKEELALLKALWDDLGVRDKYRKAFESTVRQYEKSLRTELINLEREEMLRVKESLTKLAKEISNREETIDYIKKLEEYAISNVTQGIKELNEDLLKQITKAFKTLRVQSVNAVYHMNRFKEQYYYYASNGKFDFERANSSYNYNKDYLNKMKSDLNFLQNSYLNSYFCFSKASDPFLLSISVGEEIMLTENRIEYNKYLVPVNKDVMSAIIQSEYMMIQDALMTQLHFESLKGPCFPEEGFPCQIETMNTNDVSKGDRERDRRTSGNQRIRYSGKVSMSQLINQAKHDPDYNKLFVSQKNGFERKERNDSIQSSRKQGGKLYIESESEALRPMSRKELLKKFDEFENIQNEYRDGKDRDSNEYDNEKSKSSNNLNRERHCNDNYNNTNTNYDNTFNKAGGSNKKLSIESVNKEVKLSEKPQDKSIKVLVNKDKPSSVDEIVEKDSDKEKEKDCDTPYTIDYYTKSLSDFNEVYIKYHSKLSDDLKSVFNVLSPSESDFLQGINPKIIIASSLQEKRNDDSDSYNEEGFNITNDDISIIGICQIAYEPSSTNSLKLKINHLSSTSSNWLKVINSMVDFIKESCDYDTIELSLYYQYVDDHYMINNDILSLFKEKLKFTWLKIENINHERIQFLSYQNEKEANKDSNAATAGSVLCIKTSSVIKLSNTISNQNNIDDKYINTFNIQFLLNSLREQGYLLSSSSPNLSEEVLNWNTNEIQVNFPGIVSSSSSNMPIEELQKYLLQNFTSDDVGNIKLSSPSYSSPLPEIAYCLIDCRPKLQSNYSMIKDGVVYNRIKGEIGILIDSEIQQRVYLIPTEDNVNTLLICEMTPELKEIFINNNTNLYNNFANYYLKLSQDPEEKKLNSSLWMPSFKINTHLTSSSASCLEDLIIEDNEGIEAYVNAIDEYITVAYNKDSHIKSSFTIEPEQDDVIIKNEFLFGLVNRNLLHKINIPAIIFLLVTQGNWEHA